MARSEKVNFRLPTETVEALENLAAAAGATTSDVIRRLLPSPRYMAAIKLIATVWECNPLDVIFALAQKGMTIEMLDGVVGPKVDLAFLREHGTPEQIAERYAGYVEACKFGKIYKLVKPPAGAIWNEDELSGGVFAVPVSVTFTPTGMQRDFTQEDRNNPPPYYY